MSSMKKCTKCKRTKPILEFYRNSRLRDGLQNQCITCTKKRVKARAEANKLRTEVEIPPTKRYPRCKLIKDQSEFSRNKTVTDGLAAHCVSCQRSKKYEMDIEYKVLLDMQDGTCAICNKPCELQTYLSVDHDHATGKVRGLLCKRCNLGIGYFLDDPELLTSAIEYLNNHTQEYLSVI